MPAKRRIVKRTSPLKAKIAACCKMIAKSHSGETQPAFWWARPKPARKTVVDSDTDSECDEQEQVVEQRLPVAKRTKRRAIKQVWETQIPDDTPNAWYELSKLTGNPDPATVSITFAGPARVVERRWPTHLVRRRRAPNVEHPVPGREYEVREAADSGSIGWFRATCVAVDLKGATFRWCSDYIGYADAVLTHAQVVRRVRTL